MNSVGANLLVFFGLFFGFYALMFLAAWVNRNEPCPHKDGCFCRTWTCKRCGTTWTVEGVNWFHNREALLPVALNHMRSCW
jgi:hypothetical protein